VLDENGADKLLGNGDMLFLSPGTSQLLRGQGTYLSDDEITRVVDFVGTDAPQFAKELIELKTSEEEEEAAPGPLKNRDELYEAAVDVVVRERRGSVSLLQRCLGIGYGRAARLIDFMAEDGIVGEYNGSQAREVTITVAEWETMTGGDEASTEAEGPMTAATVPAKPQRINKIIPGSDESSDLEEESTEELTEESAPWEEDEELEEETSGLEGDLEEEWEEEKENEVDELDEDEEEEELADDEEWEDEEDEEDAELADDEEWEDEDDEEAAEEGEEKDEKEYEKEYAK